MQLESWLECGGKGKGESNSVMLEVKLEGCKSDENNGKVLATTVEPLTNRT